MCACACGQRRAPGSEPPRPRRARSAAASIARRALGAGARLRDVDQHRSVVHLQHQHQPVHSAGTAARGDAARRHARRAREARWAASRARLRRREGRSAKLLRRVVFRVLLHDPTPRRPRRRGQLARRGDHHAVREHPRGPATLRHEGSLRHGSGAGGGAVLSEEVRALRKEPLTLQVRVGVEDLVPSFRFLQVAAQERSSVARRLSSTVFPCMATPGWQICRNAQRTRESQSADDAATGGRVQMGSSLLEMTRNPGAVLASRKRKNLRRRGRELSRMNTPTPLLTPIPTHHVSSCSTDFTPSLSLPWCGCRAPRRLGAMGRREAHSSPMKVTSGGGSAPSCSLGDPAIAKIVLKSTTSWTPGCGTVRRFIAARFLTSRSVNIHREVDGHSFVAGAREVWREGHFRKLTQQAGAPTPAGLSSCGTEAERGAGSLCGAL